MGKYRCSDGSKVTQDQIDRKIRKAKAKVLQQCLDKYGYIFCQKCKRNDCKPVDCSHIISVDKAKKEGKTELCWDEKNIQLYGRKCHNEYDGLNFQFSSDEINND